MIKLFAILGLVLMLNACSASTRPFPKEIEVCNPSFSRRMSTIVDSDKTIIKLKPHEQDETTEAIKTAGSIVFEFPTATRLITNELRCLVRTETTLSQEKLVMITAIFLDNGLIKHYLVDKGQEIFISVVFMPLSDGSYLGTAEISYPLSAILDRFANDKSKRLVINLGNLEQTFTIESIMKSLEDISPPKPNVKSPTKE